MDTILAGERYRTWYALLLRLYPRPFRERFGLRIGSPRFGGLEPVFEFAVASPAFEATNGD
jgi:hypothetical protein